MDFEGFFVICFVFGWVLAIWVLDIWWCSTDFGNLWFVGLGSLSDCFRFCVWVWFDFWILVLDLVVLILVAVCSCCWLRFGCCVWFGFDFTDVVGFVSVLLDFSGLDC